MKYIVTLNGKKYEVEVEKVESGFKPMSRAAAAVPAPVPAPSAPAVSPSAKAGAPASAEGGAVNVTSPMPGSILEIKVSAGEAVRAGQVLLLLEAMKMENEIVAPRAAVVASVAVKKGDTVDTDDTLVVLK